MLTTVNRVNADHPLELYRFLRDEVGTTWMQFIPVVERVDAARRTGRPPRGRTCPSGRCGPSSSADSSRRSSTSGSSTTSGRCTCRPSKRPPATGRASTTRACACSTRPAAPASRSSTTVTCTRATTSSTPTTSWATSPTPRSTSSSPRPPSTSSAWPSATRLPQYCLDCDVRFACHGECPKNRFIETPDGEPGLNYLCEGFKTFFHHIDRPMRMMIDLMKSGQYASDVMELLAEEQRAFDRAVADRRPERALPLREWQEDQALPRSPVAGRTGAAARRRRRARHHIRDPPSVGADPPLTRRRPRHRAPASGPPPLGIVRSGGGDPSRLGASCGCA